MKEDDSGVRAVIWKNGSGSSAESGFEERISSRNWRLLQETEGDGGQELCLPVFTPFCHGTLLPLLQRGLCPSHP